MQPGYGISIIYEDNHLLVVDKPVNIPSQKDSSNDPDLLTILKSYIKQKYVKPGEVYLGLVHRLDRPVGGVMVFARTSKSASRLSEQIRLHEFRKVYRAVIHGRPEHRQGSLEDYIFKDEKTNTVRVVDKNTVNAKRALLDYNILQSAGGLSLAEIYLHTGRPHQIRVQLSNMGHPIFGDQKYGTEINKPGQQLALWSWQLKLKHPTTKQEMVFEAPMPKIYPWDNFR